MSFIDAEDLDYASSLDAYCETVETVVHPTVDRKAASPKLKTFLEKLGLLAVVRSAKSFFGLLPRAFSRMPSSIINNYNSDMEQKIQKLLKQDKYDVIQVEHIWMAQYLMSNKELIGSARTILVEWDVAYVSCYREMLARSGFQKLLSYLEYVKMRRYEKRAVGFFNEIIAMSEIDKEKLLGLSPGAQVEVVPNGVDTRYFALSNESVARKDQLVYVGWMEHFPNVDAVLYFAREIFPLVREKNPQARFLVFGGHTTKEVEALNSDPNISIMGYVEDLRPHLAESSVYVVPLRIGSGTRLKILEAMSAGIPVVSTSIGCEGLEVQDGENILVRDDPGEFADQVCRLMSDDDFRNRIVANARRLVEQKYDWDVISGQMDAVYERLIPKP